MHSIIRLYAIKLAAACDDIVKNEQYLKKTHEFGNQL